MSFLIENLEAKRAKASKAYEKACIDYEIGMRGKPDAKTKTKLTNKKITTKLEYEFYRDHVQ